MRETDVVDEERKQDFTQIFHRANVGFLLYNAQGVVIYANHFLESLSGYGPSELVGGGFFELVLKPEAAQTQLQKVLGVFKEAVPEFDLTIKRRSGENIDINISVTLFETEVGPHALLVLQNISNRKAFERVIESSFDKFIQTTIELDAALKKIKEQSKKLAEYKSKIQNELTIAGSVQQAIIPQSFPSNEWVEIWGISNPCSELGGDYLDVFQLDRNRLGLLIADVSGHGVHAALITAMAKVYFGSYARLYNDPAHVLARVNADLEKIFRGTGFYMSAVYSVLDLDRLTIRTATAGHENPLCYDPLTHQLTPIGNLEGGAILGSLEPGEVRFVSETNQLTEGCTLVYFTDGIPEARGPENEFFGEERLHTYIKQNHYLASREFVQGLLAATDSFYRGAEPNDDRTLLVLQVLKSPAGTSSRNEIRELFNAGQGLLDRQRHADAIQVFEKILAIDPQSFRAHYFIGRAYLHLKDFPRSESHLRTVTELNPEYYQGFYQLGIVLYNQGKFQEAREIWRLLKDKAGDYKKLNFYLTLAEDRLSRAN